MSSNRIIQQDIKKLIESGKEVFLNENDFTEFNVKLYGPKNSAYENGVWKIFVKIPENYPEEAPDIQFLNKIFHPNISEISGIVCLDVLEHEWTNKFNLYQIFEYFLPGLLNEPNENHYLNYEAGSMRKKEYRNRKVQEYIQKYATEEFLQQNFGGNEFFKPKSIYQQSSLVPDEDEHLEDA